MIRTGSIANVCAPCSVFYFKAMTKRRLLLLLPLLCFFACAKIVPLTGGEKDTKPPVMTRAEPDTFSTGFSGKEVRLTFNEFITVDDPSRNVYFSPMLKNPPQYVAGNRSLLIKIKDTLQPNTTYTIRLQGAVKDLNEGNLLEEQIYVFSTGSQIDSGSFSGYVKDALSDERVKGARVLLYENNTDLLRVKTEKPLYYSITRNDGTFSIPYIRKGSYRIYALVEEDNSLMYDRAGEGIAFLGEAVTTGEDSLLQLRLFRSAGDSLKLLRSKYEGEGRFSFKFSAPAGHLNIRAEDSLGTREMLVYENETLDSVNVWLKGKTADSTLFYLNSSDFSDTISIKAREVLPAATAGGGRSLGGGGRGGLAVPKTAVVLVPAAGKEMSLYDTLALRFSKPVVLNDSMRIRMLEDSLPIPFRLNRSLRNPMEWNLFFEKKGNVNYTLEWDRGAFAMFTSRDTTDSARFGFSFLPPDDYSSLSLSVRFAARTTPLVLTLMRDNKAIQQRTLPLSDTLVVFSKLPPGTYTIKALADENGDGVFTTGSLPEGRQPEKVFFMPGSAILRKGFDQKTVWDFDKKGR